MTITLPLHIRREGIRSARRRTTQRARRAPTTRRHPVQVRPRNRPANSTRTLAKANETGIALIADVAHARGTVIRVLAHLVAVEGEVAAAGPGRASADAGCRRAGAAHGTALFIVVLAVKVARSDLRREAGAGLGGGTGASGSDSFETGKAGDAVCALGLEGVGGT